VVSGLVALVLAKILCLIPRHHRQCHVEDHGYVWRGWVPFSCDISSLPQNHKQSGLKRGSQGSFHAQVTARGCKHDLSSIGQPSSSVLSFVGWAMPHPEASLHCVWAPVSVCTGVCSPWASAHQTASVSPRSLDVILIFQHDCIYKNIKHNFYHFFVKGKLWHLEI
jgi:hypothetical protein